MKPKNLFITLMAVLLAVSAAAQNRKQVRQYYYWINQAELAICDDNLQLADSLYTRAFSIKKPLARLLGGRSNRKQRENFADSEMQD